MRSLSLLLFAAGVYAGFYNPTNFPMPSTIDSVPFVDCSGALTNDIVGACGISYDFCKQQTQESDGWALINWDSFAHQFAAMLPWLALAVQLPSETEDLATNFMSILRVLGSPLLGAYSLTLMILNMQTLEDWLIGVIRARRVKRFSFYVQVAWVIVAQFFTLVHLFATGFYDNSMVIELCIGSLWSWMLPLVWGSVFVGSPTSAVSIGCAFESIRLIDITKVAMRNRMSEISKGGDEDQNRTECGQLEETDKQRDWFYDLEDRADEPVCINFIIAGLVGIFLQWGTTGSAVFMAYM
jgi:hypothetical protein